MFNLEEVDDIEVLDYAAPSTSVSGPMREGAEVLSDRMLLPQTNWKIIPFRYNPFHGRLACLLSGTGALIPEA